VEQAAAVEILMNASVESIAAPDERGVTPSEVAAKEGHNRVEAALAAAAAEEYVCVELRVEWTSTHVKPV